MVHIPTDDGVWVSEEYERLARIIQDYDQYLELRWIPPQYRTRDDKKPFVVVDTRTNHAVLYASELDTPTDILERLVISDNAQGNVLLRIEARELAEKLQQAKAYQDTLEEAHDKANFLFNTPLHWVREGKEKLDSDRVRYNHSSSAKVRGRKRCSGH
jgi:hypothetical protein